MTAVAPIRPRRKVVLGSRDQVRQVRLFIRSVLRDCPVVEDAVLLASELATNAITHTASGHGGMITVSVYLGKSRVRVVVLDGGSGTVPVVRPPEDRAAGGYGLTVVDATAARWGHYGGPRKRMVWFELEWQCPASSPGDL